MIDPQLDANVLIQVLANVPEFVGYALAKRANGLSYNEVTAFEFLAKGVQSDLDALAKNYGINRTSKYSATEIDAAAVRLQKAFFGDPLGRTLHLQDAKVASTAFLEKETLATGVFNSLSGCVT